MGCIWIILIVYEKKQEIISIVGGFSFSESKQLAFSTYTHEIFAFASIIPLIQFGLNSIMNVFVYIFFSVLFAVFAVSYINKIRCLNKYKLFDRLFFVIEILFYTMFYIGTIMYAYFCIKNETNIEKNSVIPTYEYIFVLPIIATVYVVSIVLYNYLYYSRINSKHFKKLYELKDLKRYEKNN